MIAPRDAEMIYQEVLCAKSGDLIVTKPVSH